MVTQEKKRCNDNHGGSRDNSQRSLFEAKRRKDEALSLHELNRKTILLKARRIFIKHLLRSGEATADHVRESIELPAGVNPVCLGSVPTPFARAGIIKRSGYVESSRPVAHGRPVAVWQLVDRAKAKAWLANNPLPQSGEM